jgi:site-specific DNA-cytosine methylase
MIDSADFSAQMRKRYYWTNIPVDLKYKKSKLVIKDIMLEGDFPTRDFSKYANTVRWNKDHTVCSFDTSGKGYYSQANRCRKPTVKSCTLPASGNDKNNIWVSDYKCRHMQPVEAERLQTLPDNYTSCLSSKVKRSEVCGNGWTVDVIAHIFSSIKTEDENQIKFNDEESFNEIVNQCKKG